MVRWGGGCALGKVHMHVCVGVKVYIENSEHSPAQLGDDHLGAKFVKLVPQVFIL